MKKPKIGQLIYVVIIEGDIDSVFLGESGKRQAEKAANRYEDATGYVITAKIVGFSV